MSDSDVVGDGAEDAGGVAADRHHAAVIRAEANGMCEPAFQAVGFDSLKLALAARSLRPGHHLADTADRKAHQRIAGAGGGEQIGRHRLQVAAGGDSVLAGARPTGVRFGLRFVAAQVEVQCVDWAAD